MSQEFNPYIYARNNPLSFVDPSGFLESEVADIGAGPTVNCVLELEEKGLLDEDVSVFAGAFAGAFDMTDQAFLSPGGATNFNFDNVNMAQTDTPIVWLDGVSVEGSIAIAPFAPPHTNSFDGFWGGLYYLWSGGNENGGRYNWEGDFVGVPPIIGVPPDVIGGPLRKGKAAIKLGNYLFNPTAFHSVKKGVLTFVNPKNFAHIVGTNPDLMFKGGKIWLTGTKTGGYFGKSYETGMKIADFLSLF